MNVNNRLELSKMLINAVQYIEDDEQDSYILIIKDMLLKATTSILNVTNEVQPKLCTCDEKNNKDSVNGLKDLDITDIQDVIDRVKMDISDNEQ